MPPVLLKATDCRRPLVPVPTLPTVTAADPALNVRVRLSCELPLTVPTVMASLLVVRVVLPLSVTFCVQFWALSVLTVPLRSTEPAVRARPERAPPVAPTSRRPTEPLPALTVRVRPEPVMAPLKSTEPLLLLLNAVFAPRATAWFQTWELPLTDATPAPRLTAPFIAIAPRRVVAPTLLAKVMRPVPELMVRSWLPADAPLTVLLKETALLLLLRVVSAPMTTALFHVCALVLNVPVLMLAVPEPLTFSAPRRVEPTAPPKVTPPLPLTVRLCAPDEEPLRAPLKAIAPVPVVAKVVFAPKRTGAE